MKQIFDTLHKHNNKGLHDTGLGVGDIEMFAMFGVFALLVTKSDRKA